MGVRMQYGPWTYPAQSKRSVHIVFILLNLLPEPHSLIILSRVDILMNDGRYSEFSFYSLTFGHPPSAWFIPWDMKSALMVFTCNKV